MDLGCGNGQITSFLAENYPFQFEGADISPIGISKAQKSSIEKANLSFFVGNMNQLGNIHDNSYDAVMMLDTLYYSENRFELLKELQRIVKLGGQLFLYFSQWIMSTEQSEYLVGNNTGLAIDLKNLKLPFEFSDLTTSGINHWNKKLEVLEEMKNDFIKEGSLELWDYRYREALRYANWGNDLYSRYFYVVNI